MAWLSGWNRRKSKIVIGSISGSQNGYQMRITVHKGSGTDTSTDIFLGPNVKDDFADIRFTKSDGTSLLNHWIESYTPGANALVWVQTDYIPIGPVTTAFYIYYDNITAPNTSSGGNTFLLFDHFDAVNLDIGKWTTNGTPTISNSILALNTNTFIFSINSFGIANSAFRARIIPRDNPLMAGHCVFGLYFDETISEYDNIPPFNQGPFKPFVRYHWDTYEYVTESYNTALERGYSGDPTLLTPGVYYIWEAQWFINSVNYLRNDSLLATHTGQIPSDNLHAFLRGYPTNVNTNVDWILIRQYISPEPTWGASGTEEIILGNLSITSTPPGARIFIDNVDQGVNTPNTITNLSPGPHDIKLTLAGYQNWLSTTTVVSGQTTSINASMVSTIGVSWLSGWNRRKSKVINGTSVGSQTDYQVRLNVHKGSGTDTATHIYLGTYVNNDFSDIRFTDLDGITPLSYWIESYTSGSIATVWIKIPFIPSSPDNTTIYIYYDNPTATTTSNGDTTFLLFDHFTGTSLDANKWNTNGSPTFSNSIMTIWNNWYIISKNAFGVANTAFRTRLIARHNPLMAGHSVFGLYFDETISEYDNIWPFTQGPFKPFLRYHWDTYSYITETFRDSFVQGYWGDPTLDIAGTYYIYDIEWPNINTGYFLRNDTLLATHSSQIPATALKVFLRSQSTNVYTYVDWMLIRKFVSPEPALATTGTEQLRGNVYITSTPSGARIFIDNVDQGVNTPYTITGLSPVTHSYRLTLSGYQDTTGTFGVIANQTTNVPTTLTLLTGSLAITSIPSGASIYIDNILQPGITTPTTITGIDPGSHTYKLTHIDYYDYNGSFSIISNQTTNVDVTMNILPCPVSPRYSGNTINLNATPKDGIGPYYVEFRKNGITIDPSRLGGLDNPIYNALENIQITRIYTLDDVDISSASFGTINFEVFMSDSCPTGAKTCDQTCTINIGCISPVCNFNVT